MSIAIASSLLLYVKDFHEDVNTGHVFSFHFMDFSALL